jgi:hypothetical protein
MDLRRTPVRGERGEDDDAGRRGGATAEGRLDLKEEACVRRGEPIRKSCVGEGRTSCTWARWFSDQSVGWLG